MDIHLLRSVLELTVTENIYVYSWLIYCILQLNVFETELIVTILWEVLFIVLKIAKKKKNILQWGTSSAYIYLVWLHRTVIVRVALYVIYNYIKNQYTVFNKVENQNFDCTICFFY